MVLKIAEKTGDHGEKKVDNLQKMQHIPYQMHDLEKDKGNPT